MVTKEQELHLKLVLQARLMESKQRKIKKLLLLRRQSQVMTHQTVTHQSKRKLNQLKRQLKLKAVIVMIVMILMMSRSLQNQQRMESIRKQQSVMIQTQILLKVRKKLRRSNQQRR